MFSEESQIWGRRNRPSILSLSLFLWEQCTALLPATHALLLIVELFSIRTPLETSASRIMILLVLALHVYIYGVLGLVDSALTRRIDYISPTTSVLDYASAFQTEREGEWVHGKMGRRIRQDIRLRYLHSKNGRAIEDFQLRDFRRFDRENQSHDTGLALIPFDVL